MNLMAFMKAEGATVDGFLAYCTSNNDWTGICTNTENQISYSCLIEAGSIINCKSKKQTPFQCIWVSDVRANAAEFWCNKEVDQMLSDEFANNQTDAILPDTISEKALPTTINSTEFGSQVVDESPAPAPSPETQAEFAASESDIFSEEAENADQAENKASTEEQVDEEDFADTDANTFK